MPAYMRPNRINVRRIGAEKACFQRVLMKQPQPRQWMNTKTSIKERLEFMLSEPQDAPSTRST